MRRRTCLLLPSVCLAACAIPTRQPRPGASESAAGDAFWSGRMGLLIHSEPPQNFQSAFELQGSAQEGQLSLLSPIGSVLARLSWQASGAVLERGAERWSAPSAEQLAQQWLQVPVPLMALLDWLQGRNSPVQGWQVDLQAYAQGRIVAKRLQPSPALTLRIALDR